jgi:preprotein translocase subunit YajC
VGGSGFLIFIVILFAVMYFVAIRPQKRKQQAVQDLLAQLKAGDEVVTVGGIYGDVVEVEDDKVTLEIAEDVHIEVARRAIAQIVPPATEFHEADDDEDEHVDVTVNDSTPAPEPVREEKRWGVFGNRTR